ncbi:hypothetical protein P3J6_90098 [Pseudoalteromonas sp. 3J6]|nr:hypothetical protein P3J6_90098 [Pseudoalteromonas sp. 3J6]|tara:strand:- start:648 stop:776 length:129 start_codon:yes stop_codon:yes gene_type:complete
MSSWSGADEQAPKLSTETEKTMANARFPILFIILFVTFDVFG